LKDCWGDLAEVLELFINTAAREMSLGDEELQGGEGELRMEVFIG